MFPESNKPPEVKNWDKARETPPSIATGEAVKAEYWVVLERVAKAISYVVTFFIVLGCAIVSKSSTLFMLKQIAVNPNNMKRVIMDADGFEWGMMMRKRRSMKRSPSPAPETVSSL